MTPWNKFLIFQRSLSSIAGLDYAHNRKDFMERKYIEESRSITTKEFKSLNLTRIENTMQSKSPTKGNNSKKRSVLRPISINKSKNEDTYFRKKLSNLKSQLCSLFLNNNIHRLRLSLFSKE